MTFGDEHQLGAFELPEGDAEQASPEGDQPIMLCGGGSPLWLFFTNWI